jgi:hypothetical protein
LFFQLAYLLKGFLDKDESNEGGKVLLGEPAANFIKYFFPSSLVLRQNKLACFSNKSFFQARLPQWSTFQYFTLRVGLFPNRLDRKNMQGTYALAYYVTVTKKKYEIGTW